jgi:hypothetical protein
MAHPAGLSPADSPFEAECDCNFTTNAEMRPAERLALPWGRCPAVYKTAAVATEPHRRKFSDPNLIVPMTYIFQMKQLFVFSSLKEKLYPEDHGRRD